MMSHSRNRRKIMDKKLSFLLFIDECFLNAGYVIKIKFDCMKWLKIQKKIRQDYIFRSII